MSSVSFTAEYTHVKGNVYSLPCKHRYDVNCLSSISSSLFFVFYLAKHRPFALPSRLSLRFTMIKENDTTAT